MFEDSLLPSSLPRKAVSLGYLVELLLLGMVVLFPLIHMEALPAVLVSPTPITPPPAPPAAPKSSAPRRVARITMQELLAAPVTIPNRIVQPSEKPGPVIEAPEVAIPGGVPWGEGRGLPQGVTIPPPPPPAVKPPATRLQVGGAVEAAKLIFGPRPEYPEIARMARLQGTVRLAAIITKDGGIGHLEVMSGPPLLVHAAMDAVAKWRYQPTLLNGEPVEVSTEIDVNFVLGE
jgi:protein TonB